MKLWKQLLINGLQNELNEVDFLTDENIKKILDIKSYKILLQIVQVLENNNLQDEDCFYKIEEIINILQENGVLVDRHDFG